MEEATIDDAVWSSVIKGTFILSGKADRIIQQKPGKQIRADGQE